VMGYQLFRILVSYSGKSKKTKQLYESALISPGKLILTLSPVQYLFSEGAHNASSE